MESLPNEEKCKKFSESQAIPYLSKVMNLLKTNDELDSDLVNNLIIRLSNSYFDYYNKFIDEVCGLYISENILKMLNDFLRKLKNESSIDYICTFLVNFSEHSPGFAKQLETSNIITHIIDRYFEMDLSNPDKCKSDRFFKLYVTIIHNFFRYPDNICKHKIDDIKTSFFKMVQLDCDDYFGIISMLILSYVVDEKEVEMLSKGKNILRNLLEKIKFTSRSPLRVEGFALNELVHGLRCIAANDEMKKIIDKENGIPILIDILKRYKKDKCVIKSTLGVLEHLCFDEDLKVKLKNQYKIQDSIKPFANKSGEIKTILDGINLELNNKVVHFHKKLKDHSPKFDVFISYCWANKDTVKHICKTLKKFQISFWLDEEQMIGSTIEAMATGIENSTLFLVGVSSSYKKSANCRHEAEYAFKLNKTMIPAIMELKYKPTSWLGFILGDKKYFEFSERRDQNNELKELIIEIHKTLSTPVNLDNVINSQPKTEVVKVEHKTIDKLVEIKNWTNEDVMNWVDKIDLSDFKSSLFDGFSGDQLLTMKETYLSGPTLFCEYLKTDYGMSLSEIIKLNTALKNLNSR